MLTSNVRWFPLKATAAANLVMIVLLLANSLGCVEIALLLQGALPPAGSRDASGNVVTSPIDGGPANTETATPLSVVLRASNSNPTLGEQLTLTCDVQGQAPAGTRYSFSDSSGRLIQSQSSSTASLTVSESDLGVQFQFRCTASFPEGSNSDSGTISVIPTG